MKKILVVEDDAPTAELVDMVLSAKGYFSVHTGDGSQVLPLAKKHRPDLILLDVMLPMQDGYSIQADLLREDQTRGIPVLIMTSKSEMQSLFETSPNVAGFIPKPFSVKELTDKVQSVLNDKF